MKTVITYGTYDLLHQGHINLLKRAKALGDYLIVGVTNDSFDRERGKLNVRGDVLERVEAVRATGLADKIIIEDYTGQKIDDILRFKVDVFAIGSDWEGKFDYLKQYCEVVYLPRTEGVSSTLIREGSSKRIRFGISGFGRIAERFVTEIVHLEGTVAEAVYDPSPEAAARSGLKECPSFEALCDSCDAVYIASPHQFHAAQIRTALEKGRHVLCETPMVLDGATARELFDLATSKGLVLLEANKTAFCPAFNHLLTLIQSGEIGEVVDIEASLSKLWAGRDLRELDPDQCGGSMFELGSYPLLPAVKLMGTSFSDISMYTRIENGVDIYTKGIIRYPSAVCTFTVGLGIKTEGNLVISGTKGYAYVPAPWWKTDYFEFRFEDRNKEKKFFYKWDDAGLRYEIREFLSCIGQGRTESFHLTPGESVAIASVMERFSRRQGVTVL